MSWLIAHNQEIALLGLGGFGGVVWAAWRQVKLEARSRVAPPVPYDWDEAVDFPAPFDGEQMTETEFVTALTGIEPPHPELVGPR